MWCVRVAACAYSLKQYLTWKFSSLPSGIVVFIAPGTLLERPLATNCAESLQVCSEERYQSSSGVPGTAGGGGPRGTGEGRGGRG